MPTSHHIATGYLGATARLDVQQPELMKHFDNINRSQGVLISMVGGQGKEMCLEMIIEGSVNQ